MGMNFKDIIRADNKRVFLNPQEFGEEHQIAGRRMNIIIDDIEMVEREKRQNGMQSYRQGVYKKQILFYVLKEEFGPLPAVGRSLTLDDTTYLITDAINEDGIYSVSLEAVRS